MDAAAPIPPREHDQFRRAVDFGSVLVVGVRLMKESLAQRLQEFPLSARVFLNDLENLFRDAQPLARRGWLLIARSGFVRRLFHFCQPEANNDKPRGLVA